MIDTHAHLDFPELLSKIDQIVNRSKEAGLTGIVIASSSLEDSKRAVGLAKKYRGFLWASVGIHPQKTDPKNKHLIKEQLGCLKQLIEGDRQVVVAIGECGLDYGPVPPGEEERASLAIIWVSSSCPRLNPWQKRRKSSFSSFILGSSILVRSR